MEPQQREKSSNTVVVSPQAVVQAGGVNFVGLKIVATASTGGGYFTQPSSSSGGGLAAMEMENTTAVTSGESLADRSGEQRRAKHSLFLLSEEDLYEIGIA